MAMPDAPLKDDETRIVVVAEDVDVPVFESLGELRLWAAEHPNVVFVQITYVSCDNSGKPYYDGSIGFAVSFEDNGRQTTVVISGNREPIETLIEALNAHAQALGREPLVGDRAEMYDGID